MRIDKWLWCIRLFKTRTKATEACTQNSVSINGHHVKPSRVVKTGEMIEIKRSGLTRRVEVLALPESRLPAKLVTNYYKDHTTLEEINAYKARTARAAAYRLPGTGRPTKKDRRDMDDFLSAIDDFFE